MSTKRSRDWQAYYSDSDENGQVSISASVDENGVISYTRHPAVTHSAGMLSGIKDSNAELGGSNSSGSTQLTLETKRPSRKKGTAGKVEALLEHSDALQDAILASKQEASIGNPCACNRASQPAAIYRCAECFTRAPLCRHCMVAAHQHMPLHWIQKWDGSQFVKESLSNLRLCIHLGHNSRPCPNASTAGPDPGRLITIIHTNGAHKMRVLFCACSASVISDAMQLVHAGLFPATMDVVRTVFTFQLLKDFDAHSVAARKSIQRQCKEIQRLTEQYSPVTEPSRYTLFIPVARVWRQLMARISQDDDGGMQLDFEGNSHATSSLADSESRFNESGSGFSGCVPRMNHAVTYGTSSGSSASAVFERSTIRNHDIC